MSVLPERQQVATPVGAKAAALAVLAEAGFAVPCFEVSPDDLYATMQQLGTPLAVRSCAAVEDGATASYAGQFRTVLNVRTFYDLQSAVTACYASGVGAAATGYGQRQGVDLSSVRMDVIVQRMIEPVLAGVAFSVDPLTGEDRVVIEACEGVCDELLAGQRQPVAEDHPLLARWRGRIERMARDVHRHFGCPQDIEFAIDADGLWLLQARPVTRITFSGQVEQWTTADFRDGGVSASVCSPLMWSLYERAWRTSLLGFLREIRLLGPDEQFETGGMFFGRPYWNLGAVKQCLSKLPGYVERRFDEDLSVEPAYAGDGAVTPATLLGLLWALPTAWALRRFFREQEAIARSFLTGRFDAMVQPYQGAASDPAEALRSLVAGPFMQTECAYFRTIFAASLARLVFKDAFPHADEALLVTGLPPLRHLAPMRRMREMAQTNQVDTHELLTRFGHHQLAGLDVIHPRWDEQPAFVERLAGQIRQSHHEGVRMREGQAAATNARTAHLTQLPHRHRKTFNRKLDQLRAFLHLREEMRDCSSRVYHLIRRTVLDIAEQRGLGNDAFFMTVEELVADDRCQVAARRDVYERYRNFAAPNEIGGGHVFGSREGGDPTAAMLPGLAASRGCVTATARIVRTAEQASRIEPGAIMVCPFIDPGWTCTLDHASAVVTETGGMLSHAAVLCREYNRPAVLGVSHATRRIQDGTEIMVDGDRGQVRLLSVQEE